MNMIKKLAGLMNKRSLVLTLSLVLALATATGGTLAWLVDASNTVKNTFTYGDVDIKLDETVTDEDGNPVDEDGNPVEEGEEPARTEEGNELELVPGKTISKDPTVTVMAGSEDCWVFVKIEQSENLADFVEYAVAEGWTALEGVDGVYYREVAADEENDQAFGVLADDEVQVKTSVTKEMLQALTAETMPWLQFTGYAVQKEGLATAADAWIAVENPTGTTTGATE